MKRDLLLKLLDLTKEQATVLVNEDIGTYEKLIKEKQDIMNTIDALHRAQPKLKLESHEEILREIIEVDQRNRQEFDRQYEEVKEKLGKMRKEQRVAQVYNNPYDISYEEGVFFDKK